MSDQSPIQITRENEAQVIRKAIDFCFICGKPLPQRGSAEWQSTVGPDHIVPRSVLGTPGGSDTWCPILDVHRDCNDAKNREGDERGSLLHKIFVPPTGGWPKQIRSLPVRLARLADTYGLGYWHAMAGAEALDAVVWTWIRGLHTFLYKDFLPADEKYIVYPPFLDAPTERVVLLTGEQSVGKALRDRLAKREWLLTALAAAYQTGVWDGIIAWGGSLRYVCAWRWECGAARCIWLLAYQGVLTYADDLVRGGMPWIGMYRCGRPPRWRQLLTCSRLEEYERSGGRKVSLPLMR